MTYNGSICPSPNLVCCELLLPAWADSDLALHSTPCKGNEQIESQNNSCFGLMKRLFLQLLSSKEKVKLLMPSLKLFGTIYLRNLPNVSKNESSFEQHALSPIH